MDTHKKVVAILHIVFSVVELLFLLFMTTLFASILPILLAESSGNAAKIIEWVVPFFQAVAGFVLLIFTFPSIVGGIALIYKKQWAMTLLLVVGCIRLLSFPFGTALGIYTIWVYNENKKVEQ